MATTELDVSGQAVVAREHIALAAGAALLVAGLVLVIAVLPAEYGIDPLGVGRRLGLTAIGDAQKNVDAFKAANATGNAAGGPTVAPQERAYQQETIDLAIAPGEFVEYKYRLDKGEVLVFSWKTTSRVNYEFHAEPDGAPQGYAETYDKQNAKDASFGTLTAPFSGIHGWYWENIGKEPVTVKLSAAGFYNMSHEFRKDAAPKTKMFQ